MKVARLFVLFGWPAGRVASSEEDAATHQISQVLNSHTHTHTDTSHTCHRSHQITKHHTLTPFASNICCSSQSRLQQTTTDSTRFPQTVHHRMKRLLLNDAFCRRCGDWLTASKIRWVMIPTHTPRTRIYQFRVQPPKPKPKHSRKRLPF